MMLWGITIGFFFFLLIRIWITTSQAKNKKYSAVRENYAFHCVLLILGMATDLLASLLNPYSLWDIAAILFGFEKEEPNSMTVVRWILAVAVLLICCWLLHRTYTHWEGPISQRQYMSDSQGLDESGMFRDFLSVLQNTFSEDPSLKEYVLLSDTLNYNQNGTSRDIPWYVEFAHIYQIRSSQAHIDIRKDWHSDQHCLIFSYADSKWIAAYCSETIPDDGQILMFLRYVHLLHEDCFKMIIAVKEGSNPSYMKTINGTEVEFLFKEEMLDVLVDFTGYYRAIKDLYQRPLSQGNWRRIEDIYVSLDCCVDNSTEPQPLEPYVYDWLESTELEQLAVLGDFGMGKTLFSTILAYFMIKKKARRIPILIPLRNKSPRNSNVNEIFSYFTAQYGIQPDALNILNANGRLLLIFDGFDEMDLVGNENIRKLHFQSLWSVVTPKSKILITGRPNYFLSQNEMQSALGIHIRTKELPKFKTLSLQLFTDEQILSALRSAEPSIQAGICSVIKDNNSPSFLDLIRRPSQLFQVSQIWEERHLAEKVQNLTSASILNEFLLSNFERQEEKGSQNPYFHLSSIEREYFMTGIAMRMYKMDVTAITREFFEETIVKLIDIFPEQLSDKNPMSLNLRNGKSVKKFAQSGKESMLAIINDVRTCGILITDNANNGFCFAHKSFSDLLVAKYFQAQYLKQYDSAMTISKTLSSSALFSAHLGRDLLIRKLTAELISANIPMTNIDEPPAVTCQRIFNQCQRIIFRLPGKSSPEKVFSRHLKRCSPVLRTMNSVQVEYKARLLSVFLVIAFGGPIAFLWRCNQLTKSLSSTAASFYDAKLSAGLGDEVAGIVLSRSDLYFVIGAVAAVAGLIVLFARYAIGLHQAKVDDLLLFTWYYACVDKQIQKELICSQAYPRNISIFQNYIDGYNLVQLHKEVGKKSRWKRIRGKLKAAWNGTAL